MHAGGQLLTVCVVMEYEEKLARENQIFGSATECNEGEDITRKNGSCKGDMKLYCSKEMER